MRFGLAVFLIPLSCAGQSPTAIIHKLAVDSAGGVYALQGSTITKINQWTTTVPFPAANMQLMGNLVVVGAGAVASIDPTSGKILNSSSFTVPLGVTPNSIAITAAGNIILSGASAGASATPGALNIQGEQAFLMKLDPNGKVLWSASGIGGAVTVDNAENIYVAGNAVLAQFPTTAGAFQKTATFSVCGSSGGLISFIFPCAQQYIAKVSPDGTKLLFSTYLTGKLGAYPSDIALGPDGSIYTSGLVQATDYPVTSGALLGSNPAQFVNTLCSCIIPVIGYAFSGFVSRMSADGSTLIASTYLGGSQADSASAIAVAKDGSMTVAGSSQSPDFPGLPAQLDYCRPGNSLLGTKQRNFLAQMSADGSKISGSQLIGGTNAGAGISCVTNAGNGFFADTVSPGELITINGLGVGPATSVVTDLANPQTPLGGVSVTFDGIPATLTAAGGTIVTAAVPFAIAGQQQTTMTVLHNGQPFDSRVLGVTAMSPGIFVFPPNGKTCNANPPVYFGSFTGGSPTPAPLILNADGSINACDNPAGSASVITLFMNGLGSGTPQVKVDLGSVLAVNEIGNQAAVAAVSIQIPAIDPAGPGQGTTAIYLHLTAGTQVLGDYQTNRGIPLYVK